MPKTLFFRLVVLFTYRVFIFIFVFTINGEHTTARNCKSKRRGLWAENSSDFMVFTIRTPINALKHFEFAKNVVAVKEDIN